MDFDMYSSNKNTIGVGVNVSEYLIVQHNNQNYVPASGYTLDALSIARKIDSGYIFLMYGVDIQNIINTNGFAKLEITHNSSTHVSTIRFL